MFSKSPLFLMVCLIFLFAAVVVYLGHVVHIEKESLTWPRAAALVVETQFIPRAGGMRYGHGDEYYVTYSYDAGGKSYTGQSYQYGQREFPRDLYARLEADRKAQTSFSVYYNPHAPSQAVVVPGMSLPPFAWAFLLPVIWALIPVCILRAVEQRKKLGP